MLGGMWLFVWAVYEVVRVTSKITSYHGGAITGVHTGAATVTASMVLTCCVVDCHRRGGAIKSLSSEYLVPQTLKEKIRPKNYCVRDGKHGSINLHQQKELGLFYSLCIRYNLN